jgi:hypothetical protein
MNKPLTLSLSPSRVAFVLFATVILLVTFHVSVMFIHYRVTDVSYLAKDLFDLDEEQSFGTWFSSLMLFACAGLLLLIAARSTNASKTQSAGWTFLGLGFALLSVDEVVGLHEIFNTVSDYSWTIPGFVIAAVAGVAFLPFIASLPARTRRFFILAGLIFVAGALGVERATESYMHADLLDTLDYNLSTALEEALEMSGVIVMIFALLDYVAGSVTAEARLELHAT